MSVKNHGKAPFPPAEGTPGFSIVVLYAGGAGVGKTLSAFFRKILSTPYAKPEKYVKIEITVKFQKNDIF
jgi:hypothetical protein